MKTVERSFIFQKLSWWWWCRLHV